MKIKDGFVLREVSGNHIVVAVGEGTKVFNGMIQLNETSAFLWKMLQSDVAEQDLVNGLVAEYNVEKSIAESDVKEFIDSLKEANLLR